MRTNDVETWLYPTSKGLFCAAGNFFIDPSQPVERAVITHGHADHAKSGHGAVLATPETIAIMKVRYGEGCANAFQPTAYGTLTSINQVEVKLVPAGHILGSAQVVLEKDARRVVVSGDYKRASDPTCEPFELVTCDVFITEATFALPVFKHEIAATEIQKLLKSRTAQPNRLHLVGAYGLGKCQRIIKLLREAGYDDPVLLHGAMVSITNLYADLGFQLGDTRPVAGATADELARSIVICPPSALNDRWSRRFSDPVTCLASGWMKVKGRARQRGVELPLVISDHADWPELIETIIATGAEDIWVTHGREDALIYQLEAIGRRARALELVGREDDGD